MDLADLDTLPHKIDRLLEHHNALAPRAQSGRDRRWRNFKGADPAGAAALPYAETVWRLLDQNAARASASCSRARKARCWTSTTAPILTSPRPIQWRRRRRPAPAWDRARSVMSLASASLYDPGRRGPFPTNRTTRSAAKIGERGREFGTNTGRKRRCGWFDAVLVRQTVRTCGIAGLALTKLDILDGFDTIEVCVGYMLDGKEIDHLPAGEGAQARVVPVYETIEGWKEPPPMPAPGRTCRRRPSNMSAGSRNWWAAQSPCFPPARNARILFWFRTRSRLNEMLPESPHC